MPEMTVSPWWPRTRVALIVVCAGVAVAGYLTAGDPLEGVEQRRDELILADARRLTLEAEGFVPTPYHPSAGSGVTIGYGYDMGTRTSADIRRDLIEVEPAVDARVILRLGDAAGLTGTAASAFVATHGDVVLTELQAQDLFDLSYAAETDAARDFASNPETYSWLGVEYPAIDWNVLGPEVLGIVIDLKFRGDYRPWWPKQRELHAAIGDNDPVALLEQLRRIEIFPDDLATIAPARFEARIQWLEGVLES